MQDEKFGRTLSQKPYENRFARRVDALSDVIQYLGVSGLAKLAALLLTGRRGFNK